MAKHEEICNLKDLLSVIEKSQKNLNIKYIDHNDTYMFENLAKAKQEFKISDIKSCMVQKGSHLFYVKFSHKDLHYKEFDILKLKSKRYLRSCIDKKSLNLLERIPRQKELRGICETKFKDIKSLFPYMNDSKQTFYKNLTVNPVTDLQSEVTEL